jgi:hypothetical protein
MDSGKATGVSYGHQTEDSPRTGRLNHHRRSRRGGKLKAVFIVAALIGVGLATWWLIILTNAARDRMRRINNNPRKRRFF